MSLPEIIAYAAVLFIGIPSMLRNWTAVALVGSFLVVHFAYIVTGETSLALDILCDYAVVVAVLVKAAPADCIQRERGNSGTIIQALKHCRGSWMDLSRADKIVLGLFAPAWAAYAIDAPQIQYWTLWSVGLLQFVVAGAEAFVSWHRGRGTKADATPADHFFRRNLVGHEC